MLKLSIYLSCRINLTHFQLQHTYSGVEKGIKAGGKPVEVMGLLLGRPGTDEAQTLIITDAFPLPIEGFETRVIADDQVLFHFWCVVLRLMSQ